MDALENIFTRRSIRRYEARKIEDDKIRTILEAGFSAPSANNSRPWEFLVVRDKDVMEYISAASPNWGMLKYADTCIITLANLDNYRGSNIGYFVQDCSAATENMLLAAHALGLGGVWLGLYPKEDIMEIIRDKFGIPKEIYPFSVISIGYPAETKNKHAYFYEDRVHFEKY